MATIDLGKISFTQKGTYSNSTSYAPKDVVQHTDQNETSSFVKIGSTATGQAPQTNGTINSSHWAIFAKGSSLATPNQGTYAAGTTYTKGAVVSYDDGGVVSTFLYINNTPASGQTPSTSGVVNSSHWQLLAKGTDSVGIAWQSVQTANFTAGNSKGYPVNTTSGSITINLPAGSVGAQIEFADYAETWGTNKIIIIANGSDKIEGSTLDFENAVSGGAIALTFIDSTKGWILTKSNAGSAKTTADVLSPKNQNVRLLVIGGGGGGGGDNGGGGGAGGFRHFADLPLAMGTTYNVVVGSGASGGSSGTINKGGDSSFIGGSTSITAAGGGGGSSDGVAVNSNSDGGSGGGGGQNTSAGGNGNSPATDPVQGFDGGFGSGGESTGGGGGGAGGAGNNGGNNSGGAGGSSVNNDITGTSVAYAGGGGGGADQSSPSHSGSGGGAGAGNGGSVNANGNNASTANVGSGGGGGGQGGSNVGGAGSAGVVILRLPTADNTANVTGSTGSPTISTSGSDTIYKWTGAGSITLGS